MQVHGPGADLDTICIGPAYVNREVDWGSKYFCLCGPSKSYPFVSDF